MFFLDLKRAGVAIASGRLDDAFNVLRSSSEVTHRDGQKLVDRLAGAFLVRAARHLAEGRIEDARQDGQKALQLAGRTTGVTELLANISAAESERRHRRQRRDDVLASARQQVQAGAYSLGAQLLGGLNADPSASGIAAAEQLAESIEARRAIVENAASRIQAAIDAGDFEAAVGLLGSLSADQRAASAITALVPKAIGPIVESGLAELAAGRLDRAQAGDRLVSSARLESSQIAELHQSVVRCSVIREHLRASRFADAQSELAALEQTVSGSTWIKAAKDATNDVIQQLHSLMTGPLGLLSDRATDVTYVPEPQPLQRREAVPSRLNNDGLPVRSILQVDGVGGLLLLTDDVITVGATAKSSAFDISLMTEGPAVPMTLRRDGDDYFAECVEAFVVNGQQMNRRLLVSGDSVSVGVRGRLRFLKPVAASGSAVLQITGSRISRRDVRSIVLMSDSLLFGPAGCHFRLDSAECPIVLHRTRNGYALRQMTANRVPIAEPVVLALGDSVVMNETRFALVEC